MTKNSENRTDYPDTIEAPLTGLVSAKHFRDIGPHSHEKSQLLYIKRGFIKVYLEDALFLIPKGQAILIPAGIRHRGLTHSDVEYINLYFNLTIFNLPKTIKHMDVSPLLNASINKVPDFPKSYDKDSPSFHLALVIADEINLAAKAAFSLPLPTDKRCDKIITYFEKAKDEMPTLQEISNNIGASSRTLTRIFQKETGMSFEKWRQKYLLLRAIVLLTEGHSTTSIAQKLGYSNDSAFIAMFKRLSGKTPSRFY